MVFVCTALFLAWRSVPGPLSAGLGTSRVLPWGVGGAAVAVGRANVGAGISVVAVSVVGCSEQTVPPAPTPTNPPVPRPQMTSEIVQDMITRMNAGDIEGSLAYFADDAVAYIIGLLPTGIEVYTGKE